jgi:hypothetical protein
MTKKKLKRKIKKLKMEVFSARVTMNEANTTIRRMIKEAADVSAYDARTIQEQQRELERQYAIVAEYKSKKAKVES